MLIAAVALHVVLALGLTAPVAVAQEVPAPNPPSEVDETPFDVEGLCEFPVRFELSGKAKTVLLPGGRTLFTSPGLDEAGFVLAIGNFSFAFDAEGTLIQPLAGKGQLIDVCELLR